MEVDNMSGEQNLRALLASMQPRLEEGEFVFCTMSAERAGRLSIHPVGLFRESEGITVILDKHEADNEGLKYYLVSRMITLDVHSSLEAVGFLAVIMRKLAEEGISVNPVSGYFHDHLFVPKDKARNTMRVLEDIMHNSA
ncbi:ACT domain-containing protein [Candidatus Hydrogenedentota bacterium]